MAEMQFVIFRLGKEKYCVDISNVSSITEFKEITTVPDAPYYIEGIINLRGDIIPIINLKKRFGVDAGDNTEEIRIMVVNVTGKDIGFIVDEASQVTRVSDEFIDDAPEIIKGKGREYITGVAKIDNEIVIILDLERILSDDEKSKVLELKED